MNRVSLVALPLLFAAATAFAQSPQSSIRESTDPARVAEVERRAQELRTGQSTMGSGAQAQTQRSMSGDHGHMHGDRMHGNHMRNHGGRHGHHRMHQDHPKAAPHRGR